MTVDECVRIVGAILASEDIDGGCSMCQHAAVSACATVAPELPWEQVYDHLISGDTSPVTVWTHICGTCKQASTLTARVHPEEPTYEPCGHTAPFIFGATGTLNLGVPR